MGKIILLSAVSGAGKDVFVKGILERFKSFHFPESFTTKTLSERDMTSTKKYVSISDEDFMEKVNYDFFFEFGQSHGHYYGTSRKALRQASNEKKDLLLEIDVKKAYDLLKQKEEFDYGFKPKGVFLWRKFHPFENFKATQFSKFVEESIRHRDPKISTESVKRRVSSAINEYCEIRKNRDLFELIENVEGDPWAAVNSFAKIYSPTMWPR